MTTMPLVQVHGVNDVRIDQVPQPHCGPDDVLVRVSACGICGSDLGYIDMGGLTPPGVPMPLGHEFCGVVEEAGENVAHLAAGQFVTVDPMAIPGTIGNGGDVGAFAPLLRVPGVAGDPSHVLPLPDSLTVEQGAMIEPLAVATHAVNQSGIEAGDSACILGAGPIGLCILVVLRYRGIEDIVVVDRSEHRLATARKLGAGTSCRAGAESLEACLRERHGLADFLGNEVPATAVYFEATGVGAVLSEAIDLAAPGATIAVVGLHKAPIELHPVTLMSKELRLVGSMAYPTEFPVVIEMLASGRVDISPLVTHRFTLADFEQALAVSRDTEQAIKVLITP